MKKIIFIMLLSMVVVFGAEAHKYKKARITISIQTFYDQLSPYGDWIYSPDYGYVWRPYFDHPESFRPYSSNGKWVYTDYGWTWASGYNWGWATFHYGRWDFDNYLGWMWIPGYEWAPAWVSWGSYGNYWGWAPMGPNIYVNSNWYAPDPWWTFVPQNHFYSNNWNRYIYNRPVNVIHITHITNVYVNNNNYKNRDSWYYGPRVSEVERYSRNRVTTVKITDSQRPERTQINNNRMEVYRPAVDNKRNDYRPDQYRTTSQVRTGEKIKQTSARTNDPGVNRTREVRTESRSTAQSSAQRSTNATRETKVDARNVAKKSENRVSNRIAEPKSGVSVRETRPNVTEGNRPTSNTVRVKDEQKSQSRTQSPAYENRSNSSSRGTRPNVTEGNRPISNTSRLENANKSQARSITPAVENRNTNSLRRPENKRATNAQPTREQRTKDVTPSSNSRTQNTETQKSTKEDVKKAVRESRNEIKSSENRSSANPGRR